MASRTCRGFCELDAESRYASGLPWIGGSKTGKSARRACASSFRSSSVVAIWSIVARCVSASAQRDEAVVGQPEKSDRETRAHECRQLARRARCDEPEEAAQPR